jgi:hypothetical protein
MERVGKEMNLAKELGATFVGGGIILYTSYYLWKWMKGFFDKTWKDDGSSLGEYIFGGFWVLVLLYGAGAIFIYLGWKD